jgi:hypothetical protein
MVQPKLYLNDKGGAMRRQFSQFTRLAKTLA